MIRNSWGRLGFSASLLALTVGLSACGDEAILRAKPVESYDELIGGPSAKGKLGDFLMENDKIRVIIAGTGPTYVAGMFGGSVLDVDLHRVRSEENDGSGWDSFSEAFPLANLLVANTNTNALMRSVSMPVEGMVTDGEDPAIKVTTTPGTVEVINDGSEGQAAVIRVTGRSDYMFDMLRLLNRDLIDGFLEPYASFLPMVDTLLASVYLIDPAEGESLNVNGLLNRLQISFNLETEYILHPGDDFLIMETTVNLAPPSDGKIAGCPVQTCESECDNGYAFEEITLEDGYGRRMCPSCACANGVADMPTFNESRDFFSILLGRFEDWINPAWKGGVVAGDFLFFGSEAAAFLPGLGFDVDRKVYEDMWQGVGTMGSPIIADWVGATGMNVSYAWTTVNPNERRENKCPTYRLGLSWVSVDHEDDVATVLTNSPAFDLAANLAEDDAKGRVRQAIVDRKPIYLSTLSVPANAYVDPTATYDEVELQQRLEAFRTWVTDVKAGEAQTLATAFGNTADDKVVAVDLFPAHSCMASKLMIPLFSSSATAVLTHFTEGDGLVEAEIADPANEGSTMTVQRDSQRSFKYMRYLTVGQGDVASALESVYKLRNTPYGHIDGAVLDDGSLSPVSHIDVFVLADPRADPEKDPIPTTFREYRTQAIEAFGHSGIVNQLQTDVGRDPDLDGDFYGPMEPGRYLLMAYEKTRGFSPMVSVVVTEGQTSRVVLTINAPAKVEYRVTDESGMAIPCRLSFLAIDPVTNEPMDWVGPAEVELGDSRLDNGVLVTEHSPHGTGEIEIASGKYKVMVSRGYEYSVQTVEEFEVVAAKKVPLVVALTREVDTTNHVAADLHVHSRASVDSSLDQAMRIKATVSEGVEVFVASDHDHIVDYMPWVYELGLEGHLLTITSMETSPLEWGHYNGWPVKFDDSIRPIHDPAPWHNEPSMSAIWAEMRERSSTSQDLFLLQANHPRDGTMGYFNQIGLDSYNLERATSGMMMCSKATEEAPCDFDAFEVMNGKNLHYLHTPTIGEVIRHNLCITEITDARDKAKFAFPGSVISDEPLSASAVPTGDDTRVCGWLQAPPTANCGQYEGSGGEPSSWGDIDPQAVIRRIAERDHCRWHAAMRESFANCNEDGVNLIQCKQHALEGLKLLSVRYMIERTPAENDAFFFTRPELETDADAGYACDVAGCPDVGCDQRKACQSCMESTHPECFDSAQPWSAECSLTCKVECSSSDIRACTDRQQPIEDWFAFNNAGLHKTITGNSDSHKTQDEMGYPRNLINVGTDTTQVLTSDLMNQAIKAQKVVVSAGPMIDFELINGDSGAKVSLGETLSVSDGGGLKARIRVQTPSWFAIDRIELYRNGTMEKQIFVEADASAIVDYDSVIDLDRPDVDSWYAVMAKGLNDHAIMSPTYKRHPYGHILIATVISLAADQLLLNYSGLLEALRDDTVSTLLASFGLEGGVDGLLGGLGSIELPDSVDLLPFAITNAIYLDVDDGKYVPAGVTPNPDGTWPLPPFCMRSCDDFEEGDECPINQVCAKQRGDCDWADGEYTCQWGGYVCKDVASDVCFAEEDANQYLFPVTEED